MEFLRVRIDSSVLRKYFVILLTKCLVFLTEAEGFNLEQIAGSMEFFLIEVCRKASH